MHRTLSVRAGLVWPFLLTLSACPPPQGATEEPVGTQDSAETVDTGPPVEPVRCGSYLGAGPYRIPDPGDGDGYCRESEPNDDPDNAVPCGTLNSPFGDAIYFTNVGRIGGEGDETDTFVVRMGPQAKSFTQYSWWDSGTNLVDQVLYEVIDDCTDLVEVHRWDSTDVRGEHLSHSQSFRVESNTIYLLEFQNVNGEGEYHT